MSADNPYSAPLAHSDGPTSTQQQRPLGEIARTTFIAWEKLRLIYIGVLAVLTLAMGWPAFGDIDFWGMVIVGAFIANVCYFAGPIIETYVTWLGYRGGWLRTALFLTGTLLACGLAFVVMIVYALPPPPTQTFTLP